MTLRYPAIPLATSDPYFNIWSMTDKLNGEDTLHWTGKKHRLVGFITVDDIRYRFMGTGKDDNLLEQTSVKVSALSTQYSFVGKGFTLSVKFTSPLLPDDLLLLSRPVSYIETTIAVTDGKTHDIAVEISADDEICLDYKGEYRTVANTVEIDGLSCARVGSTVQNVLEKCGDNLRIDWGYFYLSTPKSCGEVTILSGKGENGLAVNTLKATSSSLDALFVLAYDDLYSLEYFGEHLEGYWKSLDKTIENAICSGTNDYLDIIKRCDEFSANLEKQATLSGGSKYADLLSLAYRQAVSAHKLALDKDENLLFISKENFSNGCAATVDVTFPSSPLFLLYRPELLEAMLRPVFRYARQPEWCFDFAPHDVGTYPILNGQVYSGGTNPEFQMPIEECGNMLILSYSLLLAGGSNALIFSEWDLLKKWADYLCGHSFDKEEQLCTDDFAGHLAGNTNLTLKGIMGVVAFSELNKIKGNAEEAKRYRHYAEEMKDRWLTEAANEDGTYRLAYDSPDSFSMKYNLVWDILWQTNLFPIERFEKELASYRSKHLTKYGMPLDNRADYSKADWLLFIAALFDDKADFEKIAETLWHFYNDSPSRVPLGDWYDTKTVETIMFRNRSVVGGFFIKLLKDKMVP